VLRWPHGGHGDCASARAGYGVRQWARPAGTRVGGRFTALQRHQRCCRFEAFTVVPWKVLRASDGSAKAENARMRSPTHWGGRSMPGDHAPPQGGALGAVLGVLLRNYGFTDLPPSLPLPPSDPVTRISESSYRRTCRSRSPRGPALTLVRRNAVRVVIGTVARTGFYRAGAGASGARPRRRPRYRDGPARRHWPHAVPLPLATHAADRGPSRASLDSDELG
jgi:hypothetical protein